MRLINYLSEEEDILIEQEISGVYSLAEMVKKDCQKYLRELGIGRNEPFKRGMKIKSNWRFYGKNKVRQNRKPRAWPKHLFKKLNEYLESEGGARRDRSVMASSTNLGHLKLFGDVYWIFPIGNYKYSWVKSIDFNYEGAPHSDYFPENLQLMLKGKEFTKEDFKDLIIHNKGMSEAHTKGFEIWFECKEYYFIEPRSDFIILLVK